MRRLGVAEGPAVGVRIIKEVAETGKVDVKVAVIVGVGVGVSFSGVRVQANQPIQ